MAITSLCCWRRQATHCTCNRQVPWFASLNSREIEFLAAVVAHMSRTSSTNLRLNTEQRITSIETVPSMLFLVRGQLQRDDIHFASNRLSSFSTFAMCFIYLVVDAMWWLRFYFILLLLSPLLASIESSTSQAIIYVIVSKQTVWWWPSAIDQRDTGRFQCFLRLHVLGKLLMFTSHRAPSSALRSNR